jgi:hypothetical protein
MQLCIEVHWIKLLHVLPVTNFTRFNVFVLRVKIRHHIETEKMWKKCNSINCPTFCDLLVWANAIIIQFMIGSWNIVVKNIKMIHHNHQMHPMAVVTQPPPHQQQGMSQPNSQRYVRIVCNVISFVLTNYMYVNNHFADYARKRKCHELERVCQK